MRAAADALAAAVASPGRVLLTGPIAPDGDSIGACIALARALRQLGPARVDVAGDPSYRYAWLPGADEMIPDAQVRPDYDLVVVLDGDSGRLPAPVAAAFRAAPRTGIVDHHRSTSARGYDIALVDPHAASACELVCAMLHHWQVPLDTGIAELLYAGIVYDTGGFRHSNTTPATLRLAAELVARGFDHSAVTTRILFERRQGGLALLGRVVSEARYLAGGRVCIGAASFALGTGVGAGPGDIEGIVDHLLHVQGVELACFFIEREPGRVKLSLRSRAAVDVAAIARGLSTGGGGHARAAGCVIDGTVDQVIAQVGPVLAAAVADLPLPDDAGGPG